MEPTQSGLLERKRILVMGLLDTRSFAWAIGQAAAKQGASVIYTVQNKRFRDTLLRRAFRKEGLEINDFHILPCDVTKDEDFAVVAEAMDAPLHGLVHSIGFANPKTCLTGELMDAPREDVTQAFSISAASLAFAAKHFVPVMSHHGSIIAMTFDSRRTYPNYNWMGVCKAALEATARYLARDLARFDIRVNCLSAGPQNTTAATNIPGFSAIGDIWPIRAPLGWDLDTGRKMVADSALYLLSDLSKGVTGEVLHVDGGFHITGVEKPPAAALATSQE